MESSLRRFNWGRPTREVKQRFGGKPSRVYVENVPWGNFEFDEDFYSKLEPLLEKYEAKIKKTWLSILDEIVEKFRTAVELEKFFSKRCPA